MNVCLVVDDSSTIRLALRQMLESLGFEVREAGNGSIALESCAISMPDLILLDWNMPVMGGMEFLKKLNEWGPSPRPKVLFCITENGIPHTRAAIMEGATDFVMKPFSREVLEAKLQTIGQL